jgi:DNA-binding response OmpR family regulator
MTFSASRPRVLVVEDEADVNRLVCALFEAEGLPCDTAHDGAEAIDFLSRSTYEALILDLQLPKLSGYNVLQFLRSGGSLSRLLVVVISGRPDDFHRRVDPSQVAAVVRKPFDVRKLAHGIRMALEARSAGTTPGPLELPPELDFESQQAGPGD